jgi:hypothetical protein
VAILDLDDPNNWELDWECRIYADDYANQYAIVDAIDYQYLVQWRWKIKKSRTWNNTKKPKLYLARTGSETIGYKQTIESTIYLHQVVIERKGDAKPNTNMKIIVDHADGDGFNCRRQNLRYATISFNNKNRFGALSMQEML